MNKDIKTPKVTRGKIAVCELDDAENPTKYVIVKEYAKRSTAERNCEPGQTLIVGT